MYKKYNHIIKLFSMFFLPLSLISCIAIPIPHDEWTYPPVKGTIYENGTQKGIPGVQVTIKNSPKIITFSNRLGNFFSDPVAKKSFWFIIWLGPFDRFCQEELLLKHPEYKDKNVRFVHFVCGTTFGTPKKIILDNIYMEKR